MIEHFSTVIANFGSLNVVGLMLFGVVVGMIGGALPGISPSITIALLLPLSFTLPPLQALILLGAIYMSAEFGGSISAVLLNTPGTAGAVCTALDGNPMALKGQAQDALNAAIIASSFGGLIGVLILLGFTQPLASFALRFGSSEMFWLSIAGLAIVCNLTADNFAKGVISASIGLFISTIGLDLNSSYPRFTWGSPELEAGIGLVPALLGFFAVAQIFNMIGSEKWNAVKIKSQPGSFRRILVYAFRRPVLLIRSSLIGVGVGVLPGAGASIASFLSYSEAKRFSKESHSYGTGIPEGVIASECANNSMVGGSLVPLLVFGIPGSASAAVLSGALLLHGLQPGARLFTEHPAIVYGFMISFIPIIAIMFSIGSIGARYFAKVLQVRAAFIIPMVLVLAVIGSYTMRNNLTDVYATVICGIGGYLLSRFGYPLAPIVLGIILGPITEDAFRRSLTLGDVHGSIWAFFFGRPISVVLIIITIAMVVTAFWQEWRSKQGASNNISG